MAAFSTHYARRVRIEEAGLCVANLAFTALPTALLTILCLRPSFSSPRVLFSCAARRPRARARRRFLIVDRMF